MQFIGRKLVEQALSPAKSLQLSRDAFALLGQGKVRQTLRSVIASDDGSLMGTMPACITGGRYAGFGLKTVKLILVTLPAAHPMKDVFCFTMPRMKAIWFWLMPPR